MAANKLKISDFPLRRRFRVLFVVVGVVSSLSLLKFIIHWLDFEILSLNALFTSAIAAAVFIIGFLLSSVLADYKEADRMPAEIRVALEAIHDDTRCFARTAQLPTSPIRQILLDIVSELHICLDQRTGQDLTPVIAQIDRLTEAFSELEVAGMPPNYVVRLRAEQSTLRRCVFRIYHIQHIQFVPSVHVLVQTLTVTIVSLLLFLKTEGSPESALIFGAITYMFIYALYLIRTLEQPFHKGKHSLDDVSTFLLREFVEKLERMP